MVSDADPGGEFGSGHGRGNGKARPSPNRTSDALSEKKKQSCRVLQAKLDRVIILKPAQTKHRADQLGLFQLDPISALILLGPIKFQTGNSPVRTNYEKFGG